PGSCDHPTMWAKTAHSPRTRPTPRRISSAWLPTTKARPGQWTPSASSVSRSAGNGKKASPMSPAAAWPATTPATTARAQKPPSRRRSQGAIRRRSNQLTNGALALDSDGKWKHAMVDAFATLASESFAFLETSYGFQQVISNGATLRWENGETFIQILY